MRWSLHQHLQASNSGNIFDPLPKCSPRMPCLGILVQLSIINGVGHYLFLGVINL